jgi:Na+-driven multidrug efflux pump
MNTLVFLLTVAAFLVAATTLTASVIFWGFCKKKENSWTSEVPLEREARWDLERRRMRWALVSIFGYALAMVLAMVLKSLVDDSQALNLTLIALSTGGILITSLRATIHNSRSFEASLDRTNPNRPPY